MEIKAVMKTFKVHMQQLLYIKDVEQIIGRNRLTIRRWWEKGQFPKPTKLHSNVLAWKVTAIQSWINENIKESRITPIV